MYTSRGYEMEDYIDEYWLNRLRLWRSTGRGIGFANGVFDIIHLDHIRLLNFAKSHCDVLVVGVNSDESVKKIKGPGRPIMSEQSRLYVVRHLKPVGLAFLFSDESPQELVKLIEPDILVKGPDWRGKSPPRSAQYSKRFLVADHDEVMHTSSIIERIKNNDNT
jgi:D-beta-D-heptose 7-phosphate kinase / D-beta-D-heptose 1-phosphate adenosyltransferase